MGEPKNHCAKACILADRFVIRKKSFLVGDAINNCQTAAASCIWHMNYNIWSRAKKKLSYVRLR